jgi:hypothetical protein
MEDLLQKYKNKQPEVVFEWHDTETDAEGWIVINSLRGGAAGGGTRMRKGLTRDEVTSLAKVMEIKFSVAGPAIGGAKSGINFDPNDPRRTEVLRRWYKAALPLLKNYYGTGGDLNVDELKDVIPITEALGLWHPQEGIVRGHIQPNEGLQISIIGQLRYGCSKVVEDPAYLPEGGAHKQAVADLITGFGVAEAVRHFYDLYHRRAPEGKTAIIQGWGNVASAAAVYLANAGVKIIGIIDREGGLIVPEGPAGDAIVEAVDSLVDRLIFATWDSTPEPYGGPLISRRAAEQALSALQQRIGMGARVIRASGPVDNHPAAFVRPAILDVTGVDVPDEEMFAPFLSVTRVPTFEAAIAAANATRYGLSAGLVSDDPAN